MIRWHCCRPQESSTRFTVVCVTITATSMSETCQVRRTQRWHPETGTPPTASRRRGSRMGAPIGIPVISGIVVPDVRVTPASGLRRRRRPPARAAAREARICGSRHGGNSHCPPIPAGAARE
jgi:hypothetical protein